MKQVTMSEVKDELPELLRAAQKQQVVTKRGSRWGCWIGFAGEEEWTDYQLENDSAVLKRVASARKSINAGKGVRLENVR